MLRFWAIILAAAALTGCRSNQQPTNPFLRTTVPPPGTGEAAVVVPGDPYYPGTPAAPAAAPVVPAAPAAPQAVTPAPPKERNKAIPGGDLFYHQSSTDAPAPPEEDLHGEDEADGHDARSLAVNAAAPNAIRLGGPSDAVAQALADADDPGPVEMASFEASGGRLPGEPAPPPKSKAPVRDLAEPTELHYSSNQEVTISGQKREAPARSAETVSDFDSTSTASSAQLPLA